MIMTTIQKIIPTATVSTDLFRISAKRSTEPNQFDIYVGGIKISSVLSHQTRQEVEKKFQTPRIWERYFAGTTIDTDLEITQVIAHLISAMEQ